MSGPACLLAHLDGAYVLGALSPEERLEYEHHLPGCPSCSRSVRELAGLPGLLAQVPADVLDPSGEPEPVPDTLLPSLVRQVRRSERRRHVLTGLAAAAAVAVVGGSAVAVGVAVGGDQAPTADPGVGAASSVATTAPAEPMTPLGQDAVDASLALTTVGWGTRLDLTCTYEKQGGVYPEAGSPTYRLLVRDRDGRTEQVASWKGLPGKTMRLTGATALAADQIAEVEIVDAGGRPLLELNG